LKQGIVLFAHGSRDPAWARPLKKIALRLSREFLVAPAYLEIMKPSLEEAVASLAAAGVKRVRVVPVFLGVGGHVRKDLPKLVSAARARHRGVKLVLEKPIGEQPAVIAAIAKAVGRSARR